MRGFHVSDAGKRRPVDLAGGAFQPERDCPPPHKPATRARESPLRQTLPPPTRHRPAEQAQHRRTVRRSRQLPRRGRTEKSAPGQQVQFAQLGTRRTAQDPPQQGPRAQSPPVGAPIVSACGGTGSATPSPACQVLSRFVWQDLRSHTGPLRGSRPARLPSFCRNLPGRPL